MSSTQRSRPSRRPAHAKPAGGRLVRLGWTTGDQMISSATNAALSFLVAREVSADAFGSFAFAFVAYMYAIGVSKALVSDPLIVRFSGSDRNEQDKAIADSAGSSMMAGAVLGVISGLLGLAIGGLTGTLLIILAVLLPGLILQNHWRLAFFAAQRPRSAFANDFLWGALQLVGVISLIASGQGSAEAYLAVWGASAGVAALFGVWQARVTPRVSAAVSWIRAHRDIGLRFTWSFVINQGAFNTAFVLIGAVAGIAVVGALRAAQVLMGPLRVLYSALGAYFLPLMSSRATQGGKVGALALVVSGTAGTAALGWTGALSLLPDGLGEALLGETWRLAQNVIGLFGLQTAAVAIALGAALGLKALAEAGYTLRVTLLQAPLFLVFSAVGTAWGGAVGAVAGLLAAQLVGACYAWWLFRRALQRRAGKLPSAEVFPRGVTTAAG